MYIGLCLCLRKSLKTDQGATCNSPNTVWSPILFCLVFFFPLLMLLYLTFCISTDSTHGNISIYVCIYVYMYSPVFVPIRIFRLTPFALPFFFFSSTLCFPLFFTLFQLTFAYNFCLSTTFGLVHYKYMYTNIRSSA
ncbi:hypothetical protein, unlikely [Trypanosoma brucei gambiense DAL972]|uniref:Uncharacterized protein n=1 Tax=Trypanosoma brucei gambiense (strain MHOM/CI/86/DAL972) TaxID=679716 RepID=C9ZQI9_TRYB9|nr:hypothetical protein, unlikely [Trypanosoma brucei gambiense DAL972]CBH11669.1 hypothetical protein, unlikely [Trypanosoma brucei gambiense DAL972]|eukprot:XP_011773954.1 hypothetical protein, unlikely [Trypanosoma brucei gambiense DAL972]